MDLSTRYLGFDLPHPFIAGASPLADDIGKIRRLEDEGAAAIVLRSLFEEQITGEILATHAATELHAETFGEATSYFPQPEGFVMGPQEYLDYLARAKQAVGVPVIASLNGTTPGGWLKYATLLAEAGADALELNLYDVAVDMAASGQVIEGHQIEMVRAVRNSIAIPVAVKLSPFYASLANFANRLGQAGAGGLVLFNRFYEPDIDLDELHPVLKLRLSKSSELLLRLRWLVILSGRVQADLAITGGVHTVFDAVKAVMCGASAVQMVSALLIRGPQYLTRIRRDLATWLEEHEYTSLQQMRGSMGLRRCPDPGVFQRANYAHMLQTWEAS